MGQVAGTSLADAYAVLKDFYAENPVDLAYARNHPAWELIEKDDGVSGRVYVQPTTIGGPQDYTDFATAQTNQVPTQDLAFQVPMATHYVLATVQNLAIQASRDDRGAFMRLLKHHTDAAMQNSLQADAWYLFRSGTGSIGKISGSVTAGGVVTLKNATDALAFQKNQVLVATSSDGGGITRAGTGWVLGVSVNTGKLLVSGTAMGGAAGIPSGWGDGDFLYPQGSINNQMSGFGGWFPDPNSALLPVLGTAKTFLGVDRSVDPLRLAGTSLDESGTDIESAFIDLISQIKAVGKGSPEYVFCNPQSRRALDKALQARRHYVDAEATSKAGITFRGPMVEDALILADPGCPLKTAFAIDMSTVKIISFGQNPGFIQYPDGLEGFRVGTADSVETRMGGYRNLTCTDPAKNGVALLPE